MQLLLRRLPLPTWLQVWRMMRTEDVIELHLLRCPPRGLCLIPRSRPLQWVMMYVRGIWVASNANPVSWPVKRCPNKAEHAATAVWAWTWAASRQLLYLLLGRLAWRGAGLAPEDAKEAAAAPIVAGRPSTRRGGDVIIASSKLGAQP